jgi:hypothetical protein
LLPQRLLLSPIAIGHLRPSAPAACQSWNLIGIPTMPGIPRPCGGKCGVAVAHHGKFGRAMVPAAIGLNRRHEGCFYPRDDASFELKNSEIVAAASFHCRGAGEI